MARQWVHGHIDTSTGRNKRDKSPLRESKPASPKRTIGTARITSRVTSARKMGIERALRRRARNN